MSYLIRPMSLEDVDEVGLVDRACYSTPWPVSAYRREIRENKLARYVVVESRETVQSGQSLPRRDGTDGSSVGLRRTFALWLRPFGVGATAAPETPRVIRIVGFAGLWLTLDEAHITTICILPDQRGLGLGDLLLSHMMDLAREMGADRVTLEVRVTNSIAQRLYRKFGFETEGVRPRYYSDNQEDALIMWSGRLNSSEYQERLAAIKSEAVARVKPIAIT